jgi:hypothetical protein
MTNPQDQHPGAGRSRWVVWTAGLIVVVAAGAATAHGLYEVALGSGTPAGIAWLYPVITDGLALVAYAATTRLTGPGRRYAWTVVVLAAGLSGLAQATYLAGALPPTQLAAAAASAQAATAPTGLRFGVGAWPAVAAAIAAHLLFLIGTTTRPEPGPVDVHVSTPGEDVRLRLDGGDVQPVSRPSVGWDTSACPTPGVQPVPSDAGQEPLPFAVNGTPERRALPGGPEVGRDGGMRRALSPAVRARTVAELHAARTGVLPSVRELADLADVGRGTAARELAALRDRSNDLHVVTDPTDQGPDQ